LYFGGILYLTNPKTLHPYLGSINCSYLIFLPIVVFFSARYYYTRIYKDEHSSKTDEEKLQISREGVSNSAPKQTFLMVIYFTFCFYFISAESSINSSSFESRLKYGSKWLIFTAFPILFALMNVNRKVYDFQTIQGERTERVDLNLRILQNHIEQLVINLPIWLFLIIHLDAAYMHLIPAIVCYYLCGRILFYYGYTYSYLKAPGRALGFSMTASPMRVYLLLSAIYITYTLFSQNI